MQQQTPPTEIENTQLKSVAQLGQELVFVDADIRSMELLLEEKKKQQKYLSEVAIPEVMSSLGLRSFQLASGHSLEVKPVYIVTLPKDNIDQAEEWLELNGHGGMVKNQFTITLPRGVESNLVNGLRKLAERYEWAYELKKAIHYQTLLKWGREMNGEGVAIPSDIFNVFAGMKTHIQW